MPHELRHVTLSLHPAESNQLLEVLEERRKDLCADGARRGLDSLYEKVADAVELGRWPRDNVRIEVDGQEAGDLVDLLLSLESDSDLPLTSLRTLRSIGRKLEQVSECRS